MRPLLLAVMLGLVGTAAGQTAVQTLNFDDCNKVLRFSGSTRQLSVKELFPEECAALGTVTATTVIDYPPPRSKPVIKMCSGITCVCDSGVNAPPAKTEPPDVPAIKGKDCELSAKQVRDGYCCANPGQWTTTCLRYVPGEYSCADNSRILLTAEDGKHWCHKPGAR